MAATAKSQSALRVERIAQTRSALPFAKWARKLSIATQRLIERATVAEAVRAAEAGDEARLHRCIEWGRNAHRRFSAPTSSQMSAALEGLHLASAPTISTRAEWLNGHAFDDDGILLYVHGGSFIAERSPRLTALIARIAKQARLNALIVDYRLAPEHPCPAAVDDVETALRDLIAQGRAPERIGIVAESAGAAIALAAVQRLRDSGAALGAMCFISPWTDLALTGRSCATRAVTGDSPISMDTMAICTHFYLQGRSPLDPTASPCYGNLAGLPPMLVHTSRTDALHDDANALAQRMHAAGGDVTLRIWSQGSHVFERFFDAQSERAIGEAGAFLRTRIKGAAVGGRP